MLFVLPSYHCLTKPPALYLSHRSLIIPFDVPTVPSQPVSDNKPDEAAAASSEGEKVKATALAAEPEPNKENEKDIGAVEEAKATMQPINDTAAEPNEVRHT